VTVKWFQHVKLLLYAWVSRIMLIKSANVASHAIMRWMIIFWDWMMNRKRLVSRFAEIFLSYILPFFFVTNMGIMHVEWKLVTCIWVLKYHIIIFKYCLYNYSTLFSKHLCFDITWLSKFILETQALHSNHFYRSNCSWIIVDK